MWGSRSDQLKTIELEDWPTASADPNKIHPLIRMEGRAVFKWAMTDVAKRAAEAIAEAGITPPTSMSSSPIRLTTGLPTSCPATSSCLSQ